MTTTADDPAVSLTAWQRRRPPPVDLAVVSFDVLYRDEYPSLLRLAFGLTGSVGEAEELVQEAFLRCHVRWSTVRSYERPGAWLRRVLLNLATSRGRRLQREARAIARIGRSPASAPPDLSDETLAFWAHVRRLPVRQRQAVALYYGDDLSVGDVASIMECAEGTVRALLHQARGTLATALEEER